MRKKIELPEVEEVKLPHIFGMRPGVYISLLSIIVLLLALFALFALPGLISKSSFISFDIKAKNIAIYEDGTYLGSSEGAVYRSTYGWHNYEFYASGSKVGEEHIKNPRNIFFTLFYRHVETITPKLDADKTAKAAIKNEFVKNIESWSKIYTHDESYHIPHLFSDFAVNAVEFSIDDISKELEYGIMHISSKELYDDYKNAEAYLKANDIEVSTIYDEALYELYEGNGVTKLRSDDSNKYFNIINGDYAYFSAYSNVDMGISIKNGTYPETNTYPVVKNTSAFALSLRTVTEYDYARFVEAVPKWEKSNKDELIAEGLADSNYLNGITLSTAIVSLKPIRNISYYAALAYTEWLSEKSGMHYSLPSEAEWYVASRTASEGYSRSIISLDSNSKTLTSMLGGLWEFTRDEYLPLQRVLNTDYTSPYSSDDIIIKGGSYIDENITRESVGVIARNKTSEYVGIRVALYE